VEAGEDHEVASVFFYIFGCVVIDYSFFEVFGVK
jgi:hypothetical protein